MKKKIGKSGTGTRKFERLAKNMPEFVSALRVLSKTKSPGIRKKSR